MTQSVPCSDSMPTCAAVGIEKNFGGIRALAGVDIDVRPGEVHALVGENGAGKSTLMKILAGAERPDAGEVLIGGEPAELSSVKDARERGVAIVFQELSLYGELDVLSNLFLAREPRRFGLINRREMRRLARPVLDAVGLAVPGETLVSRLRLAEQQLVEIAKALMVDATTIILDEPNSALNPSETERLFAIIDRLRSRDVGVLYVSHRLEEVFRLADRITVLRDGSVIETTRTAETTIGATIKAMLGRDTASVSSGPPPAAVSGEGLRLVNVRVAVAGECTTFTAARGEIIGLAGLEGSGAHDLLRVLAGERALQSGEIVLPDGRGHARTIVQAVRRGVAHVPADRRTGGLALRQSVGENLAHVTSGALGRTGFLLDRRSLDRAATQIIESLQIKGSPTMPVHQLSGGNQQKVVLGKWLAAQPRVLFLDDPTRGVDVGAKEEIYEIVRNVAAEGCVVIFSSSELRDYLSVCHRVFVFYGGAVCGWLEHHELTEDRLLGAINTGNVAYGGGNN